MTPHYPLFKVHVDADKTLDQIKSVFESGFINEGTQVTQLTDGLKGVLKADNLILVNSCTSALTLALKLAGVGSGNDVVSTPMTCVATNTPIIASGARIVWADVDPAHGMLTAASIDAAITPHTKAVMVVAWAGNPPDLQEIRRVCYNRGVPLILDAAHAFGATINQQPIHEWADYTCYSFQAIKHFTTGDGGALVCKSVNDHQRSKSLKWFGLDRDKAKDAQGNWKGQQWDVDIIEPGFKFNMNNVAAAIGLAQLPHISSIVHKHRSNAALYEKLLTNCQPIEKNRSLGGESSHWVYSVRIVPERCKLTRDELLKHLNDRGVMAGVVHVPNDTYTCFKRFKKDLPGVRKFAAEQFSLPCGWWLDENDIEHIACVLKEIVE